MYGQVTLIGRYLDLIKDCLRDVRLVTYRDGSQKLILADGETFDAGDTLPVSCRDKTAADLVRRLDNRFELESERTDSFTPDDNPDGDFIGELIAKFLGD